MRKYALKIADVRIEPKDRCRHRGYFKIWKNVVQYFGNLKTQYLKISI